MEAQRRHRSRSTDPEHERPGRHREERRGAAEPSKWEGRRDEERDGKRRRSRSPERHESYRRRHEDRDSKYRSRRHRSLERRDRDGRSSREGSSGQVSRKSRGPLPSQTASFQANKDPTALAVTGEEMPEKQQPNFAPTGLLAAASNSVSQADGTSIVLKYHEPPEARKPSAKDAWKLFVFKGPDIVDTIELSIRSCWLVGRELAVVDMSAEHPSISSQHAVIQFRHVEKTNEFGDKVGRVQPYLIDLDSANGTQLNQEVIPSSRYVELRNKDMIQFGYSTREYVLMLSPN
jgi:smad nuclear-interacting protein 1